MHLCLGTTPALQRTMIFDRFRLGEVNRAVDVRHSASGKSINVARVLRLIGQDAVATGFLGGEAGKFIRQDMDRAGIRHDFIQTAAATRTCVTIIDRAGDPVTELVEEAAAVSAPQTADLLTKFRSLLPAAKRLVLSGSLAAGVDEHFYADCCQAANAAGVPVIIDAKGPPLLHALAMRPTIVKLNATELAETVNIPTDTDAGLAKAIAAVQASGVSWVIVTMGARGAVASNGSEFWRIPALKIKVVSPIGSGDAFAAGLSAAIARGQEIPQACRLAAACAAANTLVIGAGILDPQDVPRLERQVQIIKG